LDQKARLDPKAKSDQEAKLDQTAKLDLQTTVDQEPAVRIETPLRRADLVGPGFEKMSLIFPHRRGDRPKKLRRGGRSCRQIFEVGF